MEAFHEGRRNELRHEHEYDHGARAARILNSRGSVLGEIRIAEILRQNLRRAFPDVVIKTHPLPRKR